MDTFLKSQTPLKAHISVCGTKSWKPIQTLLNVIFLEDVILTCYLTKQHLKPMLKVSQLYYVHLKMKINYDEISLFLQFYKLTAATTQPINMPKAWLLKPRVFFPHETPRCTYAAYICHMCKAPCVACNSLFMTAGLTNFLFNVFQDFGLLPLTTRKNLNSLKSDKNV